MNLSRRQICNIIAMSTATMISGCLVGDDSSPVTPPEERDRPCWQTVEGERIDKDPLFSVVNQDEMVVPAEELPPAYKKYEDERYPAYDAYIYTRTDGNTLLFDVKVYSNVSDAGRHLQDIKDAYNSYEEYGFADEVVFHNEGGFAETTIRMSNAIGSVISYVPEQAPENPEDRTFSPGIRSVGYARELRDWWGGTSDYRKEPGFCREEILEETKAG